MKYLSFSADICSVYALIYTLIKDSSYLYLFIIGALIILIFVFAVIRTIDSKPGYIEYLLPGDETQYVIEGCVKLVFNKIKIVQLPPFETIPQINIIGYCGEISPEISNITTDSFQIKSSQDGKCRWRARGKLLKKCI